MTMDIRQNIWSNIQSDTWLNRPDIFIVFTATFYLKTCRIPDIEQVGYHTAIILLLFYYKLQNEACINILIISAF